MYLTAALGAGLSFEPVNAFPECAADKGLVLDHRHHRPGGVLADMQVHVQVVGAGVGQDLAVQRWPERKLDVDVPQVGLGGHGVGLFDQRTHHR